MTEMDWRLQILGIKEAPSDLKSLKKAFARALRELNALDHNEKKQEQQQTLHEAYEELRDQFRSSKNPNVGDPSSILLDLDSSTNDDFVPLSDFREDKHVLAVNRRLNDIPNTANLDSEGSLHKVERQLATSDRTAILKWLRSLEPQLLELKTRIQNLLEHPLMSDPNAASAAEDTLVELFEALLDEGEDLVKLETYSIDHEIIELIDQKFGWLSDFMLFSQKYPLSVEIVYAFERVLERQRDLPEKSEIAWRNVRLVNYHIYHQTLTSIIFAGIMLEIAQWMSFIIMDMISFLSILLASTSGWLLAFFRLIEPSPWKRSGS